MRQFGDTRLGLTPSRALAFGLGLALSTAPAAQTLTFIRGPAGPITEAISTGSPAGGVLTFNSADLTGEGRRDLLVGIGSYPPLGKQRLPMRVLRPNAQGTAMVDVTRQLFGNGALPSSEHPREMAIADFNRDGRPDVLVADHGYDAPPFAGALNTLLLSNADGSYSDASATLDQAPQFHHAVAVADINGDGHLDVYAATVCCGSGGPYFLLGGPGGRFTRTSAGLPGYLLDNTERYHTAAFADLNGDGFPDLVLGYTPDNVVLYNDGHGDFTRTGRTVLPRGAFGSASNTVDIIPFDVDSDGRMDLLVLSTQVITDQGAAVQVLMNRGGGQFVDESAQRLGSAATRTSGNWWVFLRIADIDGDGLPDFYATGGLVDAAIPVPMVWLNRGNGTFAAVNQSSLFPATEHGPFEAIDVDGDGRLDFVSIYVGGDGLLGYRSYLNRTPRRGPQDYADMWWAGIAENGWGMSVQQHPNGIQFNALYIYDARGRPTWHVMPGGTWSNDFKTFSGPVYAPTGSPLDRFVSAEVRVAEPSGQVAITYDTPNAARLEYVIGGTSGSKALQRQRFGPPDFRYAAADASGSPRYAFPRMVGDMWWGGAAENGWGVSIVQQYRTLFSVWYSYDRDRAPTWFVMPGGAWTGDRYAGDLYSTTNRAWLGAPYDPAALVVTKVGTASLDFTSNTSGRISYDFTAGPFAGTNQSKPITRQPF